MKKHLTGITITFMLLSFIPAQMNSETETRSVQTAVNKAVESADAGVLIAGIEEINKMDQSMLNWSEKNELRNEPDTIKSNLKERGKTDSNTGTIANDGVFLTVGAIFVIILLLILLL